MVGAVLLGRRAAVRAFDVESMAADVDQSLKLDLGPDVVHIAAADHGNETALGQVRHHGTGLGVEQGEIRMLGDRRKGAVVVEEDRGPLAGQPRGDFRTAALGGGKLPNGPALRWS